MTASYCTIDDVKAAMPDNNWASIYDPLLTALVTRASRLLDSALLRWPGYFASGTAATEARYFDGNNKASLWLDAMATTPSKVEIAQTGVVDTDAGTGGTYTTLVAADYRGWPLNAVVRKEPYLRLDLDIMNGNYMLWPGYSKAVKITSNWGWSTTTPDLIEQAAVVQVVRWFKRGQQGFQDVGAITGIGQLQYVAKLDPDVETILDGFREITI